MISFPGARNEKPPKLSRQTFARALPFLSGDVFLSELLFNTMPLPKPTRLMQFQEITADLPRDKTETFTRSLLHVAILCALPGSAAPSCQAVYLVLTES